MNMFGLLISLFKKKNQTKEDYKPNIPDWAKPKDPVYDEEFPPPYWFPEREELYNSVFKDPIPEWEEWGPELVKEFHEMVPSWADISRYPLAHGIYCGYLDPIFVAKTIRAKVPQAWQRKQEQYIANWADDMSQCPNYFFIDDSDWRHHPEIVKRVKYLLEHGKFREHWTLEQDYGDRIWVIPKLVFPGKRRTDRPYLPGDNYEFNNWEDFRKLYDDHSSWSSYLRWHLPQEYGFGNMDEMMRFIFFYTSVGVGFSVIALHLVFHKELYKFYFGKDFEWNDIDTFKEWLSNAIKYDGNSISSNNNDDINSTNDNINADKLIDSPLIKSINIDSVDIKKNEEEGSHGSRIIATTDDRPIVKLTNGDNSLSIDKSGLVLVQKNTYIDYKDSLNKTLELDRLKLYEEMKDKNWKQNRNLNNSENLEENKFLSRINSYVDINNYKKPTSTDSDVSSLISDSTSTD